MPIYVKLDINCSSEYFAQMSNIEEYGTEVNGGT